MTEDSPTSIHHFLERTSQHLSEVAEQYNGDRREGLSVYQGGGAQSLMPEVPHNLEAVQAVVGASLLDNDVFEQVSAFLRVGHFYFGANIVIYEASERHLTRQRGIASAFTICHHSRLNAIFSEVQASDYL